MLAAYGCASQSYGTMILGMYILGMGVGVYITKYTFENENERVQSN